MARTTAQAKQQEFGAKVRSSGGGIAMIGGTGGKKSKGNKRPKPNPKRATSYTVADGDTRSAMQAYNEDSKSFYESRSNTGIDDDVEQGFRNEAETNIPDEIETPDPVGKGPLKGLGIRKPRKRSGSGLGAMRRGGVGIAGITRVNPRKLGGI